MGLDDTVADGQSQPGPFSHFLGGEEWIENPLQVLLRNSAAGIDDRDLHHGHGLRARLRAPGLGTTAASDGDAALLLDRMLGVDEHVHDDLLDQVRVDPDRRQIRIEIHGDLDVAQVSGPLDDARRVFDDLVEVGEFLLRRLLAGEIEKPADDCGAPLGFPDHQIQVLRVRASVRHLLPQQMRERENAGQRIVQLMSDAGGEQADRSQLFPARGLGLGNAQFLGPLFHFLLQRAPPFPQFLLGILQGRRHGVEGARQLAEFVVAAHRNRLVQIAGGKPSGPVFQVVQGNLDQAVHEEADDERGDDDEAQGENADGDCIHPHRAVDFVEGVDDVKDAEDRRWPWRADDRPRCSRMAHCGSLPCCRACACPRAW